MIKGDNKVSCDKVVDSFLAWLLLDEEYHGVVFYFFNQPVKGCGEHRM